MRRRASQFVLFLFLAHLGVSSISGAPAASSPQQTADSSGRRFTLVASSVASQQGNPETRVETTVNNVSAQSLGPIDPYVIAGGGGTSSAGNFTVTGTIGLPAAGSSLSGSTYALSGGFWNTVSGTTTVVVKKRRGQITSQ